MKVAKQAELSLSNTAIAVILMVVLILLGIAALSGPITEMIGIFK